MLTLTGGGAFLTKTPILQLATHRTSFGKELKAFALIQVAYSKATARTLLVRQSQ
jgi:hypothetical protein